MLKFFTVILALCCFVLLRCSVTAGSKVTDLQGLKAKEVKHKDASVHLLEQIRRVEEEAVVSTTGLGESVQQSWLEQIRASLYAQYDAGAFSLAHYSTLCRGASPPSSGPPNYISQDGTGTGKGEYEVSATSLDDCKRQCADASSWGCNYISWCEAYKYCYLHQDCTNLDSSGYYNAYQYSAPVTPAPTPPTPSPTTRAPTLPTPAPTKVPHIGFADTSWWNMTLWRALGSQTPRVDCNPARCSNPTECGIPNCTLVEWSLFYDRNTQSDVCDTVAKQTGTGANDCVPASMRHDWPTNDTVPGYLPEGTVCRGALGVADSIQRRRRGSTNNQLMNTVHFQPATRMVFCSPTGVYINTYTVVAPELKAANTGSAAYHAPGLTAYNWILGNKIFDVEEGGWKVSERAYFAWAFAHFAVEDGTSTRNVGHYITKRSLCKQDASGAFDCYSIMSAQCFTTNTDFATTSYASQVGTTQLTSLKSQVQTGSATRCTLVLEAKVKTAVEAFLAAQ